MIYSTEVQNMCPVAKGAYHGPAPIPEEGKWVQAKEIRDISGLTHGIGWCAPQQGACKLTLNVKDAEVKSLEEIEELEIAFRMYDGETYKTFAEIPAITLHFNVQ